MLWTAPLLIAMRLMLAASLATPASIPPVRIYFSGIVQFIEENGKVRAVLPNLQEGSYGLPGHRAILRFPTALAHANRPTMQCPQTPESLFFLEGDELSTDAGGVTPADVADLDKIVDLMALLKTVVPNATADTEIVGGSSLNHRKVSGRWNVDKGVLARYSDQAQYQFLQGFSSNPLLPIPIYAQGCLTEAVVLQLQPTTRQFIVKATGGDVRFDIPIGMTKAIEILVANAPDSEICASFHTPHPPEPLDTHFGLHYKTFKLQDNGPLPSFPEPTADCGFLDKIKPGKEVRSAADAIRQSIILGGPRMLMGGSNCPPARIRM